MDRTYEAACTFFQDLLLRKQGATFEKLALHVAGFDGPHPEVLSVEGQRQQIAGSAHRRTFLWEPRPVNERPALSFDKQTVKETTATSFTTLCNSIPVGRG